MFTAIVLSAKPVTLQLPGVTVLPRVQVLRNPAQLHAARLDALAHVTTHYCFFLDDDDALPADYLQVLDLCAQGMQQAGALMAFTDEIQREPGKEDVMRYAKEYDLQRHQEDGMALHHLVVMNTVAAKLASKALPRGNFWTEHMLYWHLGRTGGGVYVPRVGYIWNRNPKGFSRNPLTVVAQSLTRRWVNMEAAK